MGLRTYLTIAAVALGLSVAGISGCQVRKYQNELEATQEALRGANGRISQYEQADKARAKVVKVNATVEKGYVKLTGIIKEKANAENARAESAIAASPEWANVAVPAAVIDSLRD